MKSATGLTGSGSRDWFIQRVSAVVLAAYTVVLFGWILCKGGFDYQKWAGFMMTLPMKIFSFTFKIRFAFNPKETFRTKKSIC